MEEKRKKITERKNSASEPVLKKHVGLIHCENKLTLVQRKICNILLFNALDRIKEEEIHEITLRQLCSLVGYRSNDINLIKKALKSLISIVMEWNLLEDNKFIDETHPPDEKIAWYASSLLAGASIDRGLIRYSYSPQIKTVLSSLDIYGRINLFVQAKFNSNYSLVLYENCVRFKNIGRTSYFSLALFRSLMGLSANKYRSFKELNRNVIQVATNEINQKSDIKINPNYKKIGRQITAIQFAILENENYKPAFKRLGKSTKADQQEDARQLTSIKEHLVTEFKFTEQQTDNLISNHQSDYLLDKVKWVKNQKNVKNPAAYLVSALKNDYQENSNRKLNTIVPVSTENNFLRELKEASQVSFLRKKYMEYKFNCYTKYLYALQENEQQHIHTQFLSNIDKNSHLAAIYKRNKFKSPFIMAEFNKFIDEFYSQFIKNVLSFDDYISSEEEAII